MEKNVAIQEKEAVEDLMNIVEEYNIMIPELLSEIERLKKDNIRLKKKVNGLIQKNSDQPKNYSEYTAKGQKSSMKKTGKREKH